MPLDPTAVVLVAAWIPLIAAGVGALGSWLGGRSTSKQHQRQLASEERRQAMMMQAAREWQQQNQAAMEAHNARRQALIRQMAPGLGINPQLASAAAMMGPQPDFSVPSAALDPGTQGMPPASQFDYGALLSSVLGPQADQTGGLRTPSWLQFPASWRAPAADGGQ